MKAKLKFETRPNLTRTGVHVTLGKELSRTRPNLEHEIYVSAAVSCKCEDNQYRPYRDCEHIRRFIAKLVPQTPYVSGTTRVAQVDLSTVEPDPRPASVPRSAACASRGTSRSGNSPRSAAAPPQISHTSSAA